MELADSVAAIASGKAPLPAYDRTMGFRLLSWSPDGAVMEADVDENYANPTGLLHGGVLMGLADSAMGITVGGLAPTGTWATNTDLQMRFLRPTWSGRLRGIARVVRKGRRVCVMECDIVDGQERLLARASSTFLFLEGKPDGRTA